MGAEGMCVSVMVYRQIDAGSESQGTQVSNAKSCVTPRAGAEESQICARASGRQPPPSLKQEKNTLSKKKCPQRRKNKSAAAIAHGTPLLYLNEGDGCRIRLP